MVTKGNHPQMAARFRLVKYYNLPRYIIYIYMEDIPDDMLFYVTYDMNDFDSIYIYILYIYIYIDWRILISLGLY